MTESLADIRAQIAAIEELIEQAKANKHIAGMPAKLARLAEIDAALNPPIRQNAEIWIDEKTGLQYVTNACAEKFDAYIADALQNGAVDDPTDEQQIAQFRIELIDMLLEFAEKQDMRVNHFWIEDDAELLTMIALGAIDEFTATVCVIGTTQVMDVEDFFASCN